MDAGRRLSLFAGAAWLSCAPLSACAASPASAAPVEATTSVIAGGFDAPSAPEASSARANAGRGVMAPIPDPPDLRGALAAQDRRAASAGRGAIAAANRQARETSQADAFVGGVQVFAYAPGRVYEVWTAPLRVTTLTLGPGESVVSMAAGDTVRWQIGETRSGEGSAQRAHVMIKPLETGLETNLVLATSQRIYLVLLKSGGPDAFNAAIAWDAGAVLSPEATALLAGGATPSAPPALAAPAGELDARFRITPRGPRPAWTPTAVMTDGLRTFITFPAAAEGREAPVLVVRDAGGEPQIVNYRQQAGLWIVDRVFEAAELRLGGKRRQVVRILRDRNGKEGSHE